MQISSEKHPPESILQFNDLMHLLDVHEKTNIFLLMGSTNKQIISNISRHFENNPERFKRVVICSRSPTVIYQVIYRNDNRIPVYKFNSFECVLLYFKPVTKAKSTIYMRSLVG